MNAVGDDFGVGLRTEGVAEVDQARTQSFMVFDDAVVHDRNSIERDVRMGISRRRHAVCGPARMRDSHMTRNGCRLQRILEDFHLANGAQTLELVVGGQNREARGIVAAVLETAQPFHEDGHCIALRNYSDDSAHERWLPRKRSQRAV